MPELAAPRASPGCPRVIVVGAGISGLTAARRVVQGRPDAQVVVLEAASRVGGALLRRQVGGVTVDVGAEAMLARRPEGLALVAELGLAANLIEPLTSQALLRSRGLNRPLPAGTLLGIPADLAAVTASGVLSTKTLARIAAEPDSGPFPLLTDDVTVGEFVDARFGSEVVDRLVDPLLGGVYAGQARQLSLTATIPGLAARLRTSGSLLLAAQAVQQVTRSATRPAGPSAAGPSAGEGPTGMTAPVFASLAGGLAGLAEALAADARITVRTGVPVRRIDRVAGGLQVHTGVLPDDEALTADAVIVAVPAAVAATMVQGLAPVAAQGLELIPSASIAIVTMASVPVPGGSRPPAGSGMLVPALEGSQVKALTFSSQKWPLPGGVQLMRASLGRFGDDAVLHRDDEELKALVLQEVAQLTGWTMQPLDVQVQRWPAALPQYLPGHVGTVAAIKEAIGAVAGLAICGASFDGVGIPACIAGATAAADQVLDHLPPLR